MNTITGQEAKRLLEEGMTLDELIECLQDKQERKDIYTSTALTYIDIDHIIEALEFKRTVLNVLQK